MNKTIIIKGLVYETQAGRVVDYGLENLYKGGSKSLIQACHMTDRSICPPLYDKSEFDRNLCYEATVMNIEKQRIRVQVNGELGFIYFNNLARYWGCEESLKKNYKAGDKIDVRFLSMNGVSRIFAEKGVEIVPFNSFTYMEGDEVDMHVGPVGQKKFLLWFNGTPFEAKPENDPIFRRRTLSGIYSPGYPVKARVVSVNDSVPDKRFYRFSVIHEHLDYGIEAGEYICPINEVAGIRYAMVTTEKGLCCTNIPDDELPEDFPLINTGKMQARIRITGFDEYGEPIVHFASFMREFYKRYEGKSFDIELLKFNDQKSRNRIWLGPDGLFGVVSKSILDSMGEQTGKLEGHVVDGEVHISKKGAALKQIKAGALEKASILSREGSYWRATIDEKPVFIFNCASASESSDIIDVRVLYVDNANALILCIPTDTLYGTCSGCKPGSKVSMQVILKTDDRIILGNGNLLGVMETEDWDWSDGNTIEQGEAGSLYFDTVIKDITEEGVLILDRHQLLENPWDKLDMMKGQPVKVTIKEIKGLKVIVSVNGIITSISWNCLCPYNINYGRFLFEADSTVSLMLREVDQAKRMICLGYLPENDVDKDLTFDNATEYPAEVVKLIPNGILVMVKGVYGIITHAKMISSRQYIPGESINVRFVRHSYFGPAHNFEFSHIPIADRSDIIKYGNIILSAKVQEISNQRITFSYKGVRLFCNRDYAKYFSAERNKDFAQSIIKGQTFNLRVTDVQNSGVVPESMPDYTSLPVGGIFEARIEEIHEDGYLLYFEELDDSFCIPFAGFCDWGITHYETRKVGDTVKVTLASCTCATNTPVFSMISGLEDPWKDLKEGETIKVRGLGSVLRKKDFYVDVKGVPVKLGVDTMCCLLGIPWVGNKLEYNSIRKLEGNREFEMDIISIDRNDYTMMLMPHIKKIPTMVRRAQIIHNREGSRCVWVRCEDNVVGCIDRADFPEGYEFKQIIEQAVCTSFNHAKGYANLSVKALFANQEIEPSSRLTREMLQGIKVTDNMELREHQIVRGVLRNVNKEKERIFINVGPYLGIITFQDLSNMFCDVPESVFSRGREYDFYIKQIDTFRNNLLYLSRREVSPLPPVDVPIGMKVHARVCRYSDITEKIVVEVEEFNGAEAVILVSDLDGCQIRNKTRYPQIGFELTAYVKEVRRGKSGTITQIILYRGI